MLYLGQSGFANRKEMETFSEEVDLWKGSLYYLLLLHPSNQIEMKVPTTSAADYKRPQSRGKALLYLLLEKYLLGE